MKVVKVVSRSNYTESSLEKELDEGSDDRFVTFYLLFSFLVFL